MGGEHSPLTDEQVAAIEARHKRYWDGYAFNDIHHLIADLRAARAELADSDADANAWMRQALAVQAEVERLRRELDACKRPAI